MAKTISFTGSNGEVMVAKDNSDEVEVGIERAIKAALEEIGQLAEGYAKKRCPVDTGRLRNSITHMTSGNSAYIGTNVEYAPHVELGTRKQAAQPYLRPAAADHASQYRQVLKTHMENA